MWRKTIIIVTAFWAVMAISAIAEAHCEIPCGIYGDELRTNLIAEHIQTVEKSMKEITTLSAATPVNYNQLVRWVVNKDEHATKIQDVVAQYFLHQRIKPGDDHYVEKLKLLHGMLIESMKCKQTLDLAHVENLKKMLADFKALYFDHKHD